MSSWVLQFCTTILLPILQSPFWAWCFIMVVLIVIFLVLECSVLTMMNRWSDELEQIPGQAAQIKRLA